ncbi:MAG: PAS domain-containing sensor histidine kinase [candidate division Zixibacteria bacterium]|nr:PAS domain-containing sensor histidine kinase [candidate division Zixibacteria bacterium]
MEHPRRRFSDRIFDAIPGYLSVQDREFRIVECNDSFRNNFGEPGGRYCYQVYKQRPERCEDCPVARTFADGQKHTSEEVVTTLGGKDVSVLVNTTPILDEEGNVSEVIEMSTDVTQLIDLQMDLRTSRRKYRQLFEEVPCFISIQDKDLNITDANRLHRETFGTGYGRKCFEIYKHRDKECLPCTVRQTFANGEPRNHEEVVTSQSGESINVLVHTAAIRNSEGEVDSVIEMSTDITAIRMLQDKLSSVGLLIGTISHGIKGLLNSLDGGIYLINSGQEKNDNARVEKGWDIALRNINRIRSMVLDILYYAKDREPNWEQISAGEILQDVCKIMEERARTLGITLEKSVSGTGEYEGDRQMVRSLLVNLVENSLDACRIDTKKTEHMVKVEMNDKADGIQFIVSDSGIGMDRETREKAFSLFFSSKGAGGTGLGLFIAHKIVHAHGGTIRIESEEGQGSRFFVELPRKRPEVELSEEQSS